MRLSELAEKAVVNIKNGAVLGYITDLKIDSCTGKICSIHVNETRELLSFKSCSELEIPWSSICKVGRDTILVDICAKC